MQKTRALADDQPQNLTSRPSKARELVRATKPRLMKSAVAARCMRYISIPADPEVDLCRPGQANRVPIFDRPVSGRETLSQLVFVLALHFVQHLDGSPPGHGQPVQTHCCSYLQPQRWPTSAHVMSRPGSDNSPGSSPLPAPEAAAEDTRAQALSLAYKLRRRTPT